MANQIHDNIICCIGSTPIVRLKRICSQEGLECEILAKCEFLNPGGSHKDRPALLEVERAIEGKKLGADTTLIIPTTGNAGISLAMICAVRRIKCITVVPDKVGIEKTNVLKALGANVVHAPPVSDERSSESFHNLAKQLASVTDNSFLLDQYATQDNPDAHYLSTAAEIIEACNGRLDAVVIAAATSGSVSGVGRRMKEHDPNIQVIAVHTQGSTLDQENPTEFSEKVMEGGVGHTFEPEIMDRTVIDRWIKVSNRDTFCTARRVIKEEGLLCGGSSGAVIFAAIRVAKELGPGKRCVAILADGVRNYLNHFLSDDWMVKHGFFEDQILENGV